VLKQRDYHGTQELKLGGCPWWADGNDAVEARYFVSCLLGALKLNGWEVAGAVALAKHSNDKATFLLRQCAPRAAPHMCVSLSKTNRLRLIVSSSDISEEAELRLTTRMNEVIKSHWVALGPRNYGKSIEWKLEGDPWDTEGLYSDQTRGIHLLCLLLGVIQPLGWRLVASADVSSKNLDSNERGYALVGKPEDLHTWFFLYDETLRRSDACSPFEMGSAASNYPQTNQQYKSTSAHDITASGINEEKSFSPPNLFDGDRFYPHHHPLQHPHQPHPPQPVHAHVGNAAAFYAPQPEVGGRLAYQQGSGFSKSVPSVAAAADRDFPYSPHPPQQPWYDPYDAPPPPPPHAGGYLSGSQGSLSGGYGQHQAYPYYQNQSMYPGLAPKPPHMRSSSKAPSCLANAGRCSSKQRLIRQASAGSLPPESFNADPFFAGGYPQVHQAPDQGYYYGHDPGYRSEGDRYASRDSGRPASAGEGRANNNGPWEGQQEARRSATGPHNTPAMNRWKKIVRAATIAGYGSGGGDDEDEEDDEPLLRGNGYTSDGDNYGANTGAVAGENRRISRSGRFGSQGSSLCHVADVEERRRKDTDEDEDAEIEQAMGLAPSASEMARKGGRRSASRTPQSCDDEEMEEEDEEDDRVLRGAAAAGDAGKRLDADLVVSYSRYETQVAITAPSGSGGSRSGSREGLYSTPESGGENPRRIRRQSSRDGGKVDPAGPPPPPVRRGSAQLPPTSMAAKKSNLTTGEVFPSAGYRSEGSNDSPMIEAGRTRRQRSRQQQEEADLIQVADSTEAEAKKTSPRSGRRGEMRRQRSESRERGPPPAAQGAPPAFGVNSSKSLNSFDRQESSGSFHSGHSTHSAPSASAPAPYAPAASTQNRLGYGSKAQQAYGRLAATTTTGHHPSQPQLYAYPAQPQYHQFPPYRQYQQGGGLPPPPPPGPPRGRHPGHYQPQAMYQGMESCSTQSSSSSASVPPDYATCSSNTAYIHHHQQQQQQQPPSYDQAFDGYGRQQHQHPQHQAYRQPQARGQQRPYYYQQQPPQPQQQQHHPPRKHSRAAAAAAIPAPAQPQRYRENQLHYLGEFYG